MVMEHNFTSIDGSSLGYEEELASTMLGTEASSGCDNANLKREKLEPIAVIGYSAKFPQDASSPEAFWQLLCEGRSAMTEVPKDRFNVHSFYHPDTERLDSVCDNHAISCTCSSLMAIDQCNRRSFSSRRHHRF